MTDEGALQGEALLLNPPGSSCADPSCSPIGPSKNARLSTGYGVFSRKGRRGARRFQFCIERIQDVGRLFLQLCNFVILGTSARSRARSAVRPRTRSSGFEV